MYTFIRRYVALGLIFGFFATPVMAERIKDIASISGVRNNQLIGYGVVVGLDGTGDGVAFASETLKNMLSQLGVPVSADSIKLKNAAAVMVTASLPAFVGPGQQIDVTVSSIGDAKSLRGGTLLVTYLKGLDGQVYAVAQGNVLVGGAGAASGGNKVQVNHLLAGRIANGATVERSVATSLGEGEFISFELNHADFGTARRVVEAINKSQGAGTAQAVDARLVRVKAPLARDARVAFLSKVEDLDINLGSSAAKVIINPRTGSVVMNQTVTIEPCAVAHGSLSVVVSDGQDLQVSQQGGALMSVKSGANLASVVKALNALGANPQDLLAILQAMKAAGALRADLEII